MGMLKLEAPHFAGRRLPKLAVYLIHHVAEQDKQECFARKTTPPGVQYFSVCRWESNSYHIIGGSALIHYDRFR